MPYSESLAERVRGIWHGRRGISEKKMFGGIAFLLHGNMCVGILHTTLIARLGMEAAHHALQKPQVSEFNVTGRPMRGWVIVEALGLETDEQLRSWMEQCWEFVSTLDPK
jgi:TfoX/Sxy family transcriptional regulator of competence genes